MKEYWGRRKEALLELFGLPHDDHEHWITWSTIDHVVAGLDRSCNPFAGILEAPPAIGEILTRYGEAFEELEEKRQAIGTKTLQDLLCLIEPQFITRRIAADELARFGLAVTPPREEIDLMMDGDW